MASFVSSSRVNELRRLRARRHNRRCTSTTRAVASYEHAFRKLVAEALGEALSARLTYWLRGVSKALSELCARLDSIVCNCVAQPGACLCTCVKG